MKPKLLLLILLSFFNVYVTARIFDTPQYLKVQEKTSQFWINGGREDIEAALNRPKIEKVAKNVIIFLGDGMGTTVSTAGRIYKGQKRGVSGEEGYLAWERLPNMALLKTYNVDKQVADSAASATAYLAGVKANFYTVGVNAQVTSKDCKKALNKKTHTNSIVEWAQAAGKDTGFVTTTRVTHATPAALYAHSASRLWECDTKIKSDAPISNGCKDIARQLVEDMPGKDINVIFAGGRRQMGASYGGDNTNGCLRNDSRNLVDTWVEDKIMRGKTKSYVYDLDGLNALDTANTEFIMGLFEGGHLPYEYFRKKDHPTVPSLKDLTLKAIERLSKSPEGFFLLVEGGRIDHALHDTKPHLSMEELLAFDEAVEAALRVVNVDETLFLVTADHSHVMTMNGYPERGNDILGTTTYDYVTDNMPYTTLMFTTGIGTNFTYNGTHVMRKNLTGVDTTDIDYISMAIVPTEEGYETHGGEDVSVFAQGPMSHLFHRLHEQTYVAHVMGYAACIGPFKNDCPRHGTNRGPSSGTSYTPNKYHKYEPLKAKNFGNHATVSLHLIALTFVLNRILF